MENRVTASAETTAEVRSYLDACLLETLRLSAHTIGAIRKVKAQEGFRFQSSGGSGGSSCTYHLPQGSYIAASHILPHLDARNYEDPILFHPARFLGTKQGSTYDAYTFTTFSHGLHHCPGRRFAMLLMRLVVATLVTRFQLSTEQRQIPRMSFARATLGQREGAFMVVFSLRRARTID